MATAVYLETGARRVFAGALDWPGWCRSGRTDDQALEALAGSAARYAATAEEAGVAFPARAGRDLEVVERLAGNATTDFGAPGAEATADAAPLTKRAAERQAALVAAAWAVLDRTAAAAPATLRKGPRGGGRDRDAIVEHVIAAEAAYARKLGLRFRPPEPGDREAVAALRLAILDVLRAARAGDPTAEKGWRPRYAARRIAWHALDHAWEMADRGEA